MGFYTKIVGVTFKNDDGSSRQNILETLSKLNSDNRDIVLKREPENAYDKNAIAIYFKNSRIGFFSKELAKEISIEMDKGVNYTASISTITGGGDYSFGCNIKVDIKS